MSKTISIKIALVALITVAIISTYASSRAVNQPTDVDVHNECQYPTRPLVNGRCDNTDPADPTKVKGEVKQPNVFITEPPKVNKCEE